MALTLPECSDLAKVLCAPFPCRRAIYLNEMLHKDDLEAANCIADKIYRRM